jgi:hypothetical protein
LRKKKKPLLSFASLLPFPVSTFSTFHCAYRCLTPPWSSSYWPFLSTEITHTRPHCNSRAPAAAARAPAISTPINASPGQAPLCCAPPLTINFTIIIMFSYGFQ